MYHVRAARLDDVPGICAIYRSDPLEGAWHRFAAGDDSRYRSTGAASGPEDLSAFEQWMNGGPWMNPALCAVHVNSLLLGGHFPLVALAGDQAVGELELFRDRGPDGDLAHIGVLQVRKEWQRRGAGRALVVAAGRLARGLGCVRLTVEPAQEATGFYARLGFSPWLSFQALTLRADPVPFDLAWSEPERCNPVQLGWHLVLGRRQCPAQIWHQYGRPVFALPMPLFGPHPVAMVKGDGQELLLLRVRTPVACHLYGWASKPPSPGCLPPSSNSTFWAGVTTCAEKARTTAFLTPSEGPRFRQPLVEEHDKGLPRTFVGVAGLLGSHPHDPLRVRCAHADQPSGKPWALSRGSPANRLRAVPM